MPALKCPECQKELPEPVAGVENGHPVLVSYCSCGVRVVHSVKR
jgi:hypothetical protein